MKINNLIIQPGAVRMLLALTVVFYHISKFVFIGSFAVHVFFILSGYWVSKMYYEKYVHMDKTLFKFYSSRVFRIFPLYLFVSFITYTVKLIIDNSFIEVIINYTLSDWLSILMLFGFDNKSLLLGPAWSLDIELQFYLIVPLLIYIFNKRYLVIVTFIISVIVLIIARVYPRFFYFEGLILYLPYFILGMIIYLNKIKTSKFMIFTGLFLFLTILSLHYFIPVLSKLVLYGSNAYLETLNMILPIFLIPFISFNVLQKSNKFDRHLGNLSYTVYLFHWTLLIPYSYYFADLSFSNRIPYALIYLFCVVLGSLIIYQLFEKPIEKMRKNFLIKRS